MKRYFFLMTTLFMLLSATTVMATGFSTPTEVLYWDPDRAANGYTLFNSFFGAPAQPATLIDMQGRVVKQWPISDGGPGLHSTIYEDGTLHHMSTPPYVGSGPGGVFQAGGAHGRYERYSFDGEELLFLDVFDGTDGDDEGDVFDAGTMTFKAHHDFHRIWNKTLGEYTQLCMAWILKSQADAELLGTDPTLTDYRMFDRNGDEVDEGYWSPDAILEFRDNGELVWIWTFADHYVATNPAGFTMATADFTDAGGRTNAPAVEVTLAEIPNYPQKLYINHFETTFQGGPRTDVQHCNSIDYDDQTGYICINSRSDNEFYVIDHDGTFVDLTATTGYPKLMRTPAESAAGAAVVTDTDALGALSRSSAGDFLYRWGFRYQYTLDVENDFPTYGSNRTCEMYASHDIQWIRPFAWRPDYSGASRWADPTAEFALPGGGDLSTPGNFLIFDNGSYAPNNQGSYIIEINPYEDGGTADPLLSGFQGADTTGYVNPADLDRRAQVVWDFGNRVNNFYSSFISGMQRLPNGNTLVCSGGPGHLFQIEAGSTNIVWEYINPGGANAEWFLNGGSAATFRANWYPAEFPGLAGQDLTPGLTLTEMDGGLGAPTRQENALRLFREGALLTE